MSQFVITLDQVETMQREGRATASLLFNMEEKAVALPANGVLTVAQLKADAGIPAEAAVYNYGDPRLDDYLIQPGDFLEIRSEEGSRDSAIVNFAGQSRAIALGLHPKTVREVVHEVKDLLNAGERPEVRINGRLAGYDEVVQPGTRLDIMMAPDEKADVK